MRKSTDLAPRSWQRIQTAMRHRLRTFRDGDEEVVPKAVSARTSGQREAGGDPVAGHEASGDRMHSCVVCALTNPDVMMEGAVSVSRSEIHSRTSSIHGRSLNAECPSDIRTWCTSTRGCRDSHRSVGWKEWLVRWMRIPFNAAETP